MAKKAEKKKHTDELLANAEFMRQKLAESIEIMRDEPITIPYDNGGGQTGIRENPIFPAYEKLLKSYLATLNQLADVFGRDKPEEIKEAKAALSLVGNSKWKKASNG